MYWCVTLQYAGYMTPGPMAMAGEELGPKDIITLKDSVLYPPPPSKYRETRPGHDTGNVLPLVSLS